MRRFYASPADFRDGKIYLNEDETRHLRDVLRLRADDEVRVFDGAGRELAAVVETIEKRGAILRAEGEVAPPAARSPLALVLAVALLKGEKFDTVVQKAVELGVARLVPLATKRCDVKIKAAADFAKKRERLARIALEACKQSGRADLMEIDGLRDFAEFVETEREGARVMFTERGGAPFSSIEAGARLTALIGPEGGWDDGELEFARARGVGLVTLGGRILRAETAGIAIAALLQHRFGDLR